MLRKALGQLHWLPNYLRHRNRLKKNPVKMEKIFFCICDHFEPYWGGATTEEARKRIEIWVEHYPRIAANYLDSEGRSLPYSFFYPVEQYVNDDFVLMEPLVKEGFGEMEVHLHHHDDTASNLERCLTEHKKRLYHQHGMLSTDNRNHDIGYGFIHGNWALDNSDPTFINCGVNNEIDILIKTGCFADLTMPSAPHPTQTRKVNSIYRAIDDPLRPKSHDKGRDIRVGGLARNGLLMIQGPLMLNWQRRRLAVLPRIENGGLDGNATCRTDRLDLWQKARIHVRGMPNWIFIKLHTHGAKPANTHMLFNEKGLEKMLGMVSDLKSTGLDLHFVSAREMVNIILAMENNHIHYKPGLRDFRFVRP